MKDKRIDSTNDYELQAIKEFIYNDEVQDTLAHINNDVMDFNILEITGMGHYEIRHSNILGWLFDDSEHKLEYEILENFLKKVIEANRETERLQLNILDKLQSYIYLSEKKKDITIYREKDNIDLLIVDEANRVVITIENKIFAKERTLGKSDDGQLSKYENIVNKKFISKSEDFKNGYEKYFVFLTLNFDEPVKGTEYWMQASYQMIVDVIEKILSTEQELSMKTRLVLDSYLDLLKRRGIVASKELEELANKIWSNSQYKNALEVLYEYKPDMQQIISQYLQNILKGENTNELDNELKKIKDYVNFEVSSKAFVRFSDKQFDKLPDQEKGEGWTKDISKILVYEFNNHANGRLSLDLIVGPGENTARKKFFDNVNKIVHKYKKKLPKFEEDKISWPRILKIPIDLDMEGFDEDGVKQQLNEFLIDFFKEGGDFFKIREEVMNAFEETKRK